MEKLGLYLNLLSYKTNYAGIFFFREEKNFKKETKFIENDCYIFISEQYEIKVYPRHSEKLDREELLFSVKVNNNEFTLCNPFRKKNLLEPNVNNINIIKNKLWYVVNSLPKKNGKEDIGVNEDYYLNEGDMFKIGPEIFSLTKINIQNYKKNNNIDYLNFESRQIFETCFQTIILDKSKLCKHIIDELKEGKDLESIHKINEIQTNNKKVKVYKITSKICKDCSKLYPLRYKLTENSEIIEMKALSQIKESDNNKNYIRIESLEKIEEPCHKYIYYVELTGENETFTFDSDGGDIPIYSNNSSYKKIEKLYKSAIKYNKNVGKLSLENLGGYTGTMVLIQNNYFKIPEKKEIYLQSGKTFFKAKIMDKEEYENIEKEENNKNK